MGEDASAILCLLASDRVSFHSMVTPSRAKESRLHHVSASKDLEHSRSGRGLAGASVLRSLTELSLQTQNLSLVSPPHPPAFSVRPPEPAKPFGPGSFKSWGRWPPARHPPQGASEEVRKIAEEPKEKEEARSWSQHTNLAPRIDTPSHRTGQTQMDKSPGEKGKEKPSPGSGQQRLFSSEQSLHEFPSELWRQRSVPGQPRKASRGYARSAAPERRNARSPPLTRR
uniref:Uncharacterized protein LOC110201642 n=1 Tax=Phascolarctos cinereus TaxID=38626 RepID=A0A6P5JFW2_PHACI|nr:uncharacterized protein LOC110201642 [Phascolarctos cinereus]